MTRGRVLGGLGAVLVSALVCAVPACTKRAPEPSAVAKAPAPVASAPAPSASGSASAAVHGTRKQRNVEPPVYVDGKHVGILRYAELPTGLPTYARGEGTAKHFFALSDYIAALGVPVAKVKAVHILGKRRNWGSITGDELRANGKRFLFHFTRGAGGKPAVDWDTTGLSNPFKVDYFLGLAIYVEKPEPKLRETVWCIFDEKANDCANGFPYVDAEPAKGTRIYVDGRLANIVKRRLVTDNTILEGKGTSSPRYSLVRYLEGVGINTKGAKGVELVVDDDRFAGRATAEQWKALENQLAFTLLEHGHGKVKVEIPSPLLSPEKNEKPRNVVVQAINLYRKTAPPAGRVIHPLDEDDTGVSVTEGVASGTGYGESDGEF